MVLVLVLLPTTFSQIRKYIQSRRGLTSDAIAIESPSQSLIQFLTATQSHSLVPRSSAGCYVSSRSRPGRPFTIIFMHFRHLIRIAQRSNVGVRIMVTLYCYIDIKTQNLKGDHQESEATHGGRRWRVIPTNLLHPTTTYLVTPIILISKGDGNNLYPQYATDVDHKLRTSSNGVMPVYKR